MESKCLVTCHLHHSRICCVASVIICRTGLAPTLFNITLEYILAIREMSVGRNNVLTNISVQLVA